MRIARNRIVCTTSDEAIAIKDRFTSNTRIKCSWDICPEKNHSALIFWIISNPEKHGNTLHASGRRHIKKAQKRCVCRIIIKIEDLKVFYELTASKQSLGVRGHRGILKNLFSIPRRPWSIVPLTLWRSIHWLAREECYKIKYFMVICSGSDHLNLRPY